MQADANKGRYPGASTKDNGFQMITIGIGDQNGNDDRHHVKDQGKAVVVEEMHWHVRTPVVGDYSSLIITL